MISSIAIDFCTQLNVIKYFYSALILLNTNEEFYFIHRYDPNSNFRSGSDGPESNGNDRLLHIPQISGTEALSADSLVSYLGYSWGLVYPCPEMQTVYCTVLNHLLTTIIISYLKPHRR